MASKDEDALGGCIGLIVIAALFWCCGGYLGWWHLPAWMPWSQKATQMGQVIAPATAKDVQDSHVLSRENLVKWRQKVEDWKNKQEQTSQLLVKLGKDKADILGNLRAAGVQAPADLKDKPGARVLALELQELVKQTAVVKKKYEERTDAIVAMESSIRRGERILAIREVGVSDDELADLSKTITDLDEKLTKITGDRGVAPELQLDAVLEQELKGPTKP